MAHLLAICLFLSTTLLPSPADSDFVGRWDLTVTTARGEQRPSWLEVTSEGGSLKARMVGTGGGVFDVPEVAIENGELVTVIGVAGDVRHFGIAREPSPEVFLPLLQRPETHMLLIIRTMSNPTAVLPAIRAEIANLDKDVPAYDVKLMQEVLSDALAPYRLNTYLLGSFAFLAMIITASGVCGVTSYLTSRRMREVGIRMALGAERGQIRRIFVRQMLRLSAIAMVAGLLISLGLVRTLSTMLYNVSPFDPSAFAAAAVLVTCVALLASYIPALNAARLDPAATLRHE